MSPLKLVTIIGADSLESYLVKDIQELGAKGYTISYVEGKGEQELRNSAWEGENVKIITIVSDEVCNKIMDHLQKVYFDKYPMVAFSTDVMVMRSQHFL
jgi:nitrogen regulatory protein PII